MTISDERSDHGYTVEQTIEQSHAIHPEWTIGEHLAYLQNDAFFSRAVAFQAVREHPVMRDKARASFLARRTHRG